jgi:Sec-independent protein translocase protein TatA
MLIIGAVALIAFGPDQLPKVARRAGQVMRDVQNSSQSFIREMERAADEPSAPAMKHEPPSYEATPHGPEIHEPKSHESVPTEPVASPVRHDAGAPLEPGG